MIQSRSRARFAPKSFQRHGIFRHIVRQEFQRDQSAKINVLGLVNNAHASAAKFFQNPVMRKLRAGRRNAGSRLVSHRARILPVSAQTQKHPRVPQCTDRFVSAEAVLYRSSTDSSKSINAGLKTSWWFGMMCVETLITQNGVSFQLCICSTR